jgi:hypothetical protein
MAEQSLPAQSLGADAAIKDDRIMVKGSIMTRFVDGAASGLVAGAVLQPL